VFHEVVEFAFDSFEGAGINLVLCGYVIEDGLKGFGFGFETESVVKRIFISWVMLSEKAKVPGVVCLGILLMGLIILRFKRKLICFGARLTRGERSFFAAQKKRPRDFQGKSLCSITSGRRKSPKRSENTRCPGAGERLNIPERMDVFSWCAGVVGTLSEGRTSP
jgi:hypothetical protein